MLKILAEKARFLGIVAPVAEYSNFMSDAIGFIDDLWKTYPQEWKILAS